MALENKIKNDIICEKQTIYSSSFEKTKEISSTTTSTSSSSTIHSTSHGHHQIKMIPFKIFEEEVWFSGSELKTDNSSSDEDIKDKKHLTKKLTKSTSSVLPSSSSSSVDFIKKGARKKISKTILSSSSSSSSTKNRYTKTRMQQITINKQSTASTASPSSPSVSSKRILETSKSSISTNLLKPSTETDVSVATIVPVTTIAPVTNDNPEDSPSSSATKIIITDESTYEMDTGGEQGATAISSTSETLTSNVQWRPKRGSVSLPGLINELEQIQI